MYNPTFKLSLTSKLSLFWVCDAPNVLTQDQVCHALVSCIAILYRNLAGKYVTRQTSLSVNPYLANSLLLPLFLARACYRVCVEIHEFARFRHPPHTQRESDFKNSRARQASRLPLVKQLGRERQARQASALLLRCLLRLPCSRCPSLAPLAAVATQIECLSSRDGEGIDICSLWQRLDVDCMASGSCSRASFSRASLWQVVHVVEHRASLWQRLDVLEHRAYVTLCVAVDVLPVDYPF